MRTCLLLVFLVGAGCGSGDHAGDAPAATPRPPTAPTPRAAPPVEERVQPPAARPAEPLSAAMAAPPTALAPSADAAPASEFHADLVVAAPFDAVVARVSYPEPWLYSNLLYESNNDAMRGPRDADGLFSEAALGCTRLRALAVRTRGVFVLRDALFSQPDHPIDAVPEAPMLPPSWVSVGVAETLEGRALVGLTAPALDDDAAWAALTSTDAMFGSFPRSDRLFAASREPVATSARPIALRARHARVTLRALAEDVDAMLRAARSGLDAHERARAVAEAGAARIAVSDALCFGDARSHLIPISVENPSAHEIDDEGKGFAVSGRELSPESMALARAAVLRVRLAAGPLAIERYHLGRANERRRLRDVLADLVPRGSTGADVWVWANGGLDARGVGGTPPDAFVPSFRAELAGDARIATRRVRMLGKPHVDLREVDARAVLETAIQAHARWSMPVSVNVNARRLRAIVSPTPAP